MKKKLLAVLLLICLPVFAQQMMFEWENFAYTKISPADMIAQRDWSNVTFKNCNFTQAVPNTPILTGSTGVTFEYCTLDNCTLPSGSTIIGKQNIPQYIFTTTTEEWRTRTIHEKKNPQNNKWEQQDEDIVYNTMDRKVMVIQQS